ncbi:MAG TPA: methanol/ethanol family PQQ-dependent dehydrogenase [Acetobacteraceae bacterium]|nr:methanol/ethanol family PQQ-dependent dehydrogenase [Acetobacteraceae bacterium]
MKRTTTWTGCAALGVLACLLLAGTTAVAQTATNGNEAAKAPAATSSAPAMNVTGPSAAQEAANPDNWAMPSLNDAATRYSPLNQINASNANHLQVAWTFSTGVLRGHEGQPLVIGNTMYLVTPFPNTVYALDLNNNERILWQYTPTQDPDVIPVMCCDTVNRGVAYGDGMIILHQADNTVVALDAKDGKVVWKIPLASYKVGATGTDAPLVVGNKVLVGVSGGEFGVQGFLAALDIKDGHIIWKAYSEGPDNQILVNSDTTSLGKPVGADSSLKTWKGDEWKIGGGDTWGWYSYDPKLHLVYYGSGNPSTWNPNQRPGDNKWSMTIFARNIDTGVAKWVYQMTPHDQWDYDGVNEMILANLRIDGREVPALVHFDRNGLAYVLNRENGELIAAHKYDPDVNWTTGVDMNKSSPDYGRPKVVEKYAPGSKGVNVNYTGICPAALGSKDEQPAAFDPQTQLFYVPTNHVCMDYEPYPVAYTAGQPYVGATLSMYPGSGGYMGRFIAFNPVTGKTVWSINDQFSDWGGALATAGNVVFYGTLKGYLQAVDAKTGKLLYSFKTPSGIIGNVMTYMHDGKQYVAVLSGVGGWAGIGLAAGLTDPHAGLGAVGGYAALKDYTTLGGQLTVFALPEK